MSPSPTCRFAIRDMPFRRSRCYGSLTIPNLIALLLLSGVAAQETKKYLWSNRLDDEMEESEATK